VTVRAPAVAGRFYPGDEATLRAAVDEYLAGAVTTDGAPPKAIVAPHAGYMYSGAVAASAYAALAECRAVVRRVVLLGPAHRVALDGIAAPTVDAFRTPLGDVVVDTDARDAIGDLAGVVVDDRPHTGEHSVEVHLPFLQHVLTEFRVLPLVVGRASSDQVAAVLERLWGGPETLIVVSSDLSHYESNDVAHEHDRRTAAAILAGDGSALDGHDACGVYPLRGLLVAARHRHLEPRLLDLRTSGDIAGSTDRVVGYGAFTFTPASTS